MKHATLWKRILHEGLRIPFDCPEWYAYAPRAGMGLEESMATDIAVAPILMAKWDNSLLPERDEDSFWTPNVLSDFSGISPPFPTLWIEYSEGQSYSECLLENWPSRVKGHLLSFSPLGPSRWRVSGLGCVACPYTPPRAIRVFQFELRDGRVVPDTFCCPETKLWEGKRLQSWHIHTLVSYAAMNVLAMLSCKNVGLEPRDNDPKQTRIATKRYGQNPYGYRYHVLTVRPAGSRSDAPAQEIGNMPRHVCRGHFAEYGPEYGKGLLFGKYAGRFYVPPHVKGKAENGVVEKDYAIAG